MNNFNNFQKAIDLKEIGSNDVNVSVFELMPDENYFVGIINMILFKNLARASGRTPLLLES